jgi:hypothetical protein
VVGVSRVVAMSESSEEDFGVREVAGFVIVVGCRRDDVHGMDLKKSNEEVIDVMVWRIWPWVGW